MARTPLSKLLLHLQHTAFREDGTGLTDGELLERYIHHREDVVFAALVRRHGPMVMGVCRRVLGNAHDAEDAFQASFLVLARKAASIVPRERVANFLYGVAHTTALRARGLIARRRAREKQVMEMPEPEARPHEFGDDLRPLLDRELSRLPEKYRLPIVLCDLEDRPIKEAARQLGWPQGTLAGRLARARVMLAKRLARHGLTVAGGTLAVMIAQQARAAEVPARLISRTIEAAKLFAAGQAASGLIAAPVAALTEGVLRTMLLTKLRMVTAVVIAMVAVALSAAGGLYEAAAGDEPKPEALAAPPPPPVASGEQKVYPPNETKSPREPIPEAAPQQRDWNELPTSSMPRQVLVRLEKGQLLVETQDVELEPITTAAPGSVPGGRAFVTTYQRVYVRKRRPYPPNLLKVYDMKGQRIDAKQLPKLLKKETIALFSRDAEAADPINLRLFKQGTLLFVLPSTPPPVAVPAHPPAQPADAVPVPPYAPVAPVAPAARPAPPLPPTAAPNPKAPDSRFVPREPVPATKPAESPRPVQPYAP